MRATIADALGTWDNGRVEAAGLRPNGSSAAVAAARDTSTSAEAQKPVCRIRHRLSDAATNANHVLALPRSIARGERRAAAVSPSKYRKKLLPGKIGRFTQGC